MRILGLLDSTPEQREQAARILVDAFRETAPEYCNTVEEARAEVADPALRIARLAVDRDGRVMGWFGAQPHYGGRAWELHPMAVAPDLQGRGIGTALVRDLEERVREQGAITLWLGTDDETDQTNLGGVDLYPRAIAKAAALRSLRRHASDFYRKMGFEVVGVLPDANGFGKPDIFMAKRVGKIPPAAPDLPTDAAPESSRLGDDPWTDNRAVARCRELADQARAAGNTGVGAVLILEGHLVAEAGEEAPGGPDPFAHAEILVVREAVRRFGRGSLGGATLYSTAEPCFLCSYGVREAGIGRLVLGAPVADIGGVTSGYPLLTTDGVPRWSPPPTVEWWGGVPAAPAPPVSGPGGS